MRVEVKTMPPACTSGIQYGFPMWQQSVPSKPPSCRRVEADLGILGRIRAWLHAGCELRGRLANAGLDRLYA